jgi:phosphate-selective porin
MKRIILPLLFCLCPALPALADDAALQERIEMLSKELDKLKLEMQEINSRTEAIADQQQAPAPVAASGADETAASRASFWGYGEINYNRPTDDSSSTQMDLRRAVLGFGYHFDEDTRFTAEFEVEHAIVSADDDGEFAVEQFYIDHSLSANTNVKAGLFLVPMGLLNESHEPTRYYGVERNFVETAIIPTTWREGGIGLYGGTPFGLAWDLGVTTGFDLSKWDPASTEGQESPLGSIHQELQNAKAKDLSVYLALNYRGIPGWVAGASVFTGKASQGDQSVSLASDARVTLWEAHTRWTPGNFDLSALYAMGMISDTSDLNATFAGNPTLIPKEFWGGYVQGAYRFSLAGSRSLAPFVRYERFNTGSEYASLPAGLNVDSLPTETVWTTGINFYLNPHVVLKADYQHFSGDYPGDVNQNRFDLGLGLEF